MGEVLCYVQGITKYTFSLSLNKSNFNLHHLKYSKNILLTIEETFNGKINVSIAIITHKISCTDLSPCNHFFTAENRSSFLKSFPKVSTNKMSFFVGQKLCI